ncbi:hypothetical protein [Rhizobium laguerreae]|uniref:hypothetical protein n=1 Tax=Rhizobium laguerreae TaxID=1076926 RepID=UPI001C920C13|nr:hypothetical protein [Rhizobium laguerreae]MBY3296225.1 hypothetical protein [Rhizobium laguerreae]MBY3310956.1 hypothetical protein [Rhizobium laguerreae]MBY3540066.1 hypothetical protein [Rhizobium laguerreae]
MRTSTAVVDTTNAEEWPDGRRTFRDIVYPSRFWACFQHNGETSFEPWASVLDCSDGRRRVAAVDL